MHFHNIVELRAAGRRALLMALGTGNAEQSLNNASRDDIDRDRAGRSSGQLSAARRPSFCSGAYVPELTRSSAAAHPVTADLQNQYAKEKMGFLVTTEVDAPHTKVRGVS